MSRPHPLIFASALALLAPAAHTNTLPESTLATAQHAFELARTRQWRDLLAPATEIAPLPQWRTLALAELRAADLPTLLGAHATLDNWMPALTHHFAFHEGNSNSGDSTWLDVQAVQGPLPEGRAQRLPDWAAPALRERLSAWAGPTSARRTHAPKGWDGELDATPGAALVWSGPAVKTGVARYQTTGTPGAERTRVRLALWPAHTAALLRWTAPRGIALRLTLDDSTQPLSLALPVPVRIDVSIPVWLITPQGLQAATLKALHTGDACHGGSWADIEWPGSRQPAIWGTLFLPDAATAAAAQVRRLPAERPTEGSAATSVSRLEVRWPGRQLNALLISAKQFGTVWGTQADVLVYDDQGQPTARRLSGSGQPACSP